MNRTDTIGKVMDALRQAQLEFDPVLKDTRNPLYNSKYAELSGVIAATQPALAKHDLVISQLVISDLEHQGSGVTTLLVHTSGEFIASDFLLPAVGRGKGDVPRYDAQTACGAITYARRYAYLAIIGVAAEDDDGNQASGHNRSPNIIQDDAPDFQEARHAAPRPAAASKTQKAADRPTPAPAPQAEASKSEPLPTEASSTASQEATKTAKPAVAQQMTLDAPAAAREPGDDDDNDVLPTEEEMNGYRTKFSKLGDVLSTDGKLTASKGLPIQRKLLVFLLSITKATEAKNITKGQWDDFFARVEKAKALETGLVGLAQYVNKANGVEDKKK
jgi:ERF superfamily protein